MNRPVAVNEVALEIKKRNVAMVDPKAPILPVPSAVSEEFFPTASAGHGELAGHSQDLKCYAAQ